MRTSVGGGSFIFSTLWTMAMINPPPTDVRILEGEEEAKTIAYVRTSSRRSPRFRDVSHWERGWKQNLDAYMASRDPDDLMPMYIRPALPLRCNGHFVMQMIILRMEVVSEVSSNISLTDGSPTAATF